MQNRTGQHTPTHRMVDPFGARGPESWSRPGIWRLVAIVMLIVIGVLSLMPTPPEPPVALRWDKAQHALAYLVLAWWWVQCWPRRPLRVVALLVAYGIALEGLQSLSPARMLELGDMLANALGALAGAGLARTMAGRLVASLDRLLAGGVRR